MRKSLIAIFILISATSEAQVNPITVGQSFRQYATTTNNTNSNNYNNSLIVFTPKEDTEGSPYLFKDWAKGTVVLITKQKFVEPSFVLNYDKMTGKLVMKIDAQKIVEIEMEQIESFILEDSTSSYSFSTLKQTPSKFLIRLHSDSTLSFYKRIETRFYKSDYVNKGLYESGYKYDRYVDDVFYYFTRQDKTVVLHQVNKSEMKKLAELYPAVQEFIKTKGLPEQSNREAFLLDLAAFISNTK